MSDPAVPRRPTLDLRSFTPARVALGRSGASVPTRALLDFTLDHARARDAVHAVLDVPHLVADLDALGLAVTGARSQAVDRRDYLRRPDLGRQLDAGSVEALARIASRPCQLAIVIGDGLSAAAVHAHAVALVSHLLPLLAEGDDDMADRDTIAGCEPRHQSRQQRHRMSVDRGRRQAVADHDREPARANALIGQHAVGGRIEHAPEIGAAQIVAPVTHLAGNQNRL